jgi:hypothetical protein
MDEVALLYRSSFINIHWDGNSTCVRLLIALYLSSLSPLTCYLRSSVFTLSSFLIAKLLRFHASTLLRFFASALGYRWLLPHSSATTHEIQEQIQRLMNYAACVTSSKFQASALVA